MAVLWYESSKNLMENKRMLTEAAQSILMCIILLACYMGKKRSTAGKCVLWHIREQWGFWAPGQQTDPSKEPSTNANIFHNSFDPRVSQFFLSSVWGTTIKWLEMIKPYHTLYGHILNILALIKGVLLFWHRILLKIWVQIQLPGRNDSLTYSLAVKP